MTTDARESCCSGFPNCIHNQCQTCGGYGKHFRQCLVGELETALAESRDREKEWVDSYSKQTQQLVDSEKQVAALEAKKGPYEKVYPYWTRAHDHASAVAYRNHILIDDLGGELTPIAISQILDRLEKKYIALEAKLRESGVRET